MMKIFQCVFIVFLFYALIKKKKLVKKRFENLNSPEFRTSGNKNN